MEVIEIIEKVFCTKRKVFLKQAYGIVKSHEDAEDVVQRAFVKAIEYQQSFDVKHDPASWIMSIVKREALSMLSENRYQGMSREIEESDSYSNEDEDFNSRLRDEVGKMIKGIKCEKKRNVCFSFFVCGNTPRFIVQELGVDIRFVNNIVAYFKADLAVVYGGE